ncbi:SRPBCC family protein [Enhygromyxa salina]|uniref:Polyketide cyclase / dehydrase and lipid transport n=1 Tax=Enhygromyxa salina TaxID=215803 RepID=A0A2S9Y3D9_9BACT|nr:SRPBCC family protein [Enhygromyxa salina]PRP99581.1 Polyketide cyclase / dehydrase and lipid transport [Enhygromyxa salina]
MNAANTESLAGNDKPSVKLMLKWVGLLLLAAAACMLVVGLLLPREWHVEQSVEIQADVAQIHALVGNVERWDDWMFDPAQAEADMSVTTEGEPGRVGSTIKWSGKGSNGSMTLVEVDPEAGIRWDGRIETDEINNHGSIRYEPLEGGVVRVTLTDDGTLPPVLGGYFVPVMNSALSQHFEAALGRLAVAAKAP